MSLIDGHHQVLRELLDAFDEGEKDGIVTTDEFLHYYQRVGASIDDDDYFELVREGRRIKPLYRRFGCPWEGGGGG